MPPAELPRSSPVALTVLFMLMGGPIHPYEMQRRMKLWGKDLVVNLAQRATLYKTIERLLQSGLVQVVGTERDPGFPERTVYALTDTGKRTGRQWLVEMLAVPRNEYPRFPAALSFIMALTPEEACEVLQQRAEALTNQLAAVERDLSNTSGPPPPAVALLDGDFVRAMLSAELAWLEDVLQRLRSGALGWTEEELRVSAGQFLGD